MHIYDLTVPQLTKTLRNLDRWLTLAAAHAESNQLAIERVLQARLAPDQYIFVRQVQVACDNAMLIAGRLAGKEWPALPDTESTIDALRTRVATVTNYLAGFAREDFDTALERKISLPWMDKETWLTADEYLVQFALPNFYFHIVTAYAILRHVGVQLAKNDYLGELPMRS
jgi:hypothetical protein